MASNDFILSSGSDTEVSEMEDYELEVEGSPNSSFAASDEKDTRAAYADDPLADEEWLELYPLLPSLLLFAFTFTVKRYGMKQYPFLFASNIATTENNTFLRHGFTSDGRLSRGFTSRITLDPFLSASSPAR